MEATQMAPEQAFHGLPTMAKADIMGISCRLPESANVAEFWSNLRTGRDMVTSNDKRWPVGIYGLPPRSGKVPDYESFDASFFSVHGKQAQKMDPQLRKLLEVSWEAWIDSGVDVSSLRGSQKVGVYIGCCGSEVHAAWLADTQNITGYEQTGCTQSMFANRLSWTYDFRGPSKSIDTACSSSALALHDAVADLTSGRCDFALVGGASSILRPATSVAFNKLHMLSPDGTCKSFSASANGYTRSDGIVAIVLKRSDVIAPSCWAMRQPYAQILNIGTNNDGHTKEGITFPSAEAQGTLARQVCLGAGIQPSQVSYVEAHGTGTVVGDGQELSAIDGWYGRAAGRSSENPLLIGSVKSNMGHCEGASGLAGLVKLCLAYEHGLIPGNLHYTEPNPNCLSLKDGTFKVVDSALEWDGGYAALSNFGFGGSNVHMVLHGQPPAKAKIAITAEDAGIQGVLSPDSQVLPAQDWALLTQIPLSARTAEGLTQLASHLKEQQAVPQSVVASLRHFSATVGQDVSKFGCRGVYSGGELRSTSSVASDAKAWFVFSGNGSQWPQMGLSLIKSSQTFQASIRACANIALKFGVDLLSEFHLESGFKDTVRSALGLASVQIALVDLLAVDYGIQAAGMLGHSAGEIACGYASGCCTREQTLAIAYHRGSLPTVHGLQGGLMIATGLSAAQARSRVDGTSCVVACDNSPSSTTLSGPEAEIQSLKASLEAEGVFVREVETLGIAFHSPALEPTLPDLQKELKALIPDPMLRPDSWMSTSFEAESEDPVVKHCSAEYQVHSFRNQVRFTEAAKHLPENAVLIEIGPHAILRSALRQNRPSLPYIALMRRGECGLGTVAAAVSEMWRKGLPIQWPTDPVSSKDKRTDVPFPLRHLLVSWDHRVEYPMPQLTHAKGAGFSKNFELGGEHAFLVDHKIDGRTLMPATSYLITAWDALAAKLGTQMSELPVQWTDVTIHQAVHADADSAITLSVLLDQSHGFQVINGSDLIAEGKIKAMPKADARPSQAPEAGEEGTCEAEVASEEIVWPLSPSATIDSAAFYREFVRSSITYGPKFQMVQKASLNGDLAFLRWDNCFIRFLDGLLQTTGLSHADHQLRIPVRLREVTVSDPKPEISFTSSVSVDVDMHMASAKASFCGVAGVELCVAPVRAIKHHLKMNNMSWIPYGERICTDGSRKEYVRSILDKLGQNCIADEQDNVTVTDTLETRQSHLLDYLQRGPDKLGALALEAFSKDPLISGFGKSELKIMLDMAMDNQRPEGFVAGELGAGSGGFTKQALEELNSCGATSLISYIATDKTDVSATLKEAFPTTKLQVKEWDVTSPAPEDVSGRMNILLAQHVLHACGDLNQVLGHIHDCLAPGGFLLVYELLGKLASAVWSAECEAEHLPKETPSVQLWLQAFSSAGFAEVSTLRCPLDSSAMFLVRKIEEDLQEAVCIPAVPTLASVQEVDSFLGDVKTALGVGQSPNPEANNDDHPKSIVWIHGEETSAPGLPGFLKSARKEPQGSRLRYVYSRGSSGAAASLIEQCRRLDLVSNMIVDGRNGCYLAASEPEHTKEVDFREAGSDPAPYHLSFASYGDLSSLCWVQNQDIPPSIQQSLVQINVAFGSLNFRDVMLAFGKLSRDLMSHGTGGDYIGLEFSGQLASCRGHVMGVAQNAIASVVHTPSYLVWEVPASWSLKDAATVPVAYATAYYSLIMRGRLRKGMSVLIHSGSGAVGLAAIQICLFRGCEVFTTCGSESKKEFLLNRFKDLKAENIGDSRSCSFEHLIMKATGGQGVHLVLNSLADDKLQASVRCLGKRGRLLEIGKYDILKGTPLSMRPLLQNIAFDGIDLDRVFNDPEDTHEVKELHLLMTEGIKSGEVQPLPATVYAASVAEDAFRYMSKGVHIGKVMIEMADGFSPPSSTVVLREQQQRLTSRTIQPQFCCEEGSSYVITGGLGGFGLALATWLQERGAKHLLLTSSRGLRTGAQAKAVRHLRSQGVQVVISQLDVSDLGQTAELLEEAAAMGPVAGIFHLAMVLTDKWLINQTGEGWNKGVAPKAIGAQNLDMASRVLPNLQHFVMFSSLVASVGNEGQSNYGFANSCLDFLCEQRAHKGLPALSIQWGVIGHVGFVEEAMQGKLMGRLAEISLPQPVDDCLQVLGKMLCGGRRCAPVQCCYWQPTNMLFGGADSGTDKDLVTSILDIMGLQPGDVNDSDTLVSMGIDSMQLVEVRANIQRALGKPLPLEEIGTMTVGGLKALAAQAQPQAAPSKPAAAKQSAPASPAESPNATAGGRPDQPTATTSPDPPKEGKQASAKASQLKAPIISLIATSAQPVMESAVHPILEASSAPVQAAPAVEIGDCSKDDLGWTLLSGCGILFLGVLLYLLYVPVVKLAVMASMLPLISLILVLPALWLMFGFTACLGTAVLKKLIMPAVHNGKPIQLWSLAFFRWWLVHRMISLTNQLFVQHLRGSVFVATWFRALGSTVGKNCFIDSLDFMDLDQLELGDNVAIDEGASMTGHTFKGGQLHFSKVVLGDDCKLRPFSLAVPGLKMPTGSCLDSLQQKPEAGKHPAVSSTTGSKISVPLVAIRQVAGLYLLGLNMTIAACIAYATYTKALTAVGVPATVQPVGVAISALAAMISPLVLAFLPLFDIVSKVSSLKAVLIAASLLPLAFISFGLAVTLLSAVLKRAIIGRVEAGRVLRHSNAGVRLWLCERLVSVGMQGFGGMLLGSWGAAVFYRLFGASVGRWATFRMSNVLRLPDMLSIGNWAHIGDAANVVCKISLSSEEILVEAVVVEAQALLGVGSVVLPGAVIPEGATLSPLACASASSKMRPGFIHIGASASPLIKAAPGSASGETPAGRSLRLLSALLPVGQVLFSTVGISFGLTAAAGTTWMLKPVGAGDGVLVVLAASTTVVWSVALMAAGTLTKWLILGKLKPADGIEKHSVQNMARTLLWAVDSRALDLWVEAVRGSVWYNKVLRTRGLSIGGNVYLDTLFAGDYELISYKEGAIVDRDAFIFAHLGQYQKGVLAMTQKCVVIGAHSVVGPRAAVLPGSSLQDKDTLPAGQVKLQF